MQLLALCSGGWQLSVMANGSARSTCLAHAQLTLTTPHPPSCSKRPFLVRTVDDVLTCARHMHADSLAPIFLTSSVGGLQGVGGGCHSVQQIVAWPGQLVDNSVGPWPWLPLLLAAGDGPGAGPDPPLLQPAAAAPQLVRSTRCCMLEPLLLSTNDWHWRIAQPAQQDSLSWAPAEPLPRTPPACRADKTSEQTEFLIDEVFQVPGSLGQYSSQL